VAPDIIAQKTLLANSLVHTTTTAKIEVIQTTQVLFAKTDATVQQNQLYPANGSARVDTSVTTVQALLTRKCVQKEPTTPELGKKLLPIAICALPVKFVTMKV